MPPANEVSSEVEVDRRRRDLCVSKDALNAMKINASLEEMSRKSVAQDVR